MIDYRKSVALQQDLLAQAAKLPRSSSPKPASRHTMWGRVLTFRKPPDRAPASISIPEQPS